MIYFTSDTHYGHKNIVKGVSNWPEGSNCRNFTTFEEHNEKIVNSIKERATQDDILYHLGDWSFGGIENVFKFRKRIICQNVHLILGNHDKHIYSNRQNCQEIFQSVSSYLEIEIEKNFIVLSHWPMKIWNKYHKGSWQLYGHCHNNLKDDKWWTKSTRRRTMDIGVETNSFMPYSYEDFKITMEKIKEYPTDLDNHK